MKIILLDDQYGEYLTSGLKKYFPEYEFLNKGNTKNPLDYIDIIFKEKPEIILLDNWFYNGGWEEPLGNVFLLEFEKKRIFSFFLRFYTPKIIGISDNNPHDLKKKYSGWNNPLICSFSGKKDINLLKREIDILLN